MLLLQTVAQVSDTEPYCFILSKTKISAKQEAGGVRPFEGQQEGKHAYQVLGSHPKRGVPFTFWKTISLNVSELVFRVVFFPYEPCAEG